MHCGVAHTASRVCLLSHIKRSQQKCIALSVLAQSEKMPESGKNDGRYLTKIAANEHVVITKRVTKSLNQPTHVAESHTTLKPCHAPPRALARERPAARHLLEPGCAGSLDGFHYTHVSLAGKEKKAHFTLSQNLVVKGLMNKKRLLKAFNSMRKVFSTLVLSRIQNSRDFPDALDARM
eukprot:6207883-Pleurochrysis_carterae.AAC.1